MAPFRPLKMNYRPGYKYGSRRMETRLTKYYKPPFIGRPYGTTAISRRSFARGNIRSGGVLKRELKWFDTMSSQTTINTNSNLIIISSTPLNGLAQGTAIDQRIGNRAIIKKIQVNILVNSPAVLNVSDVAVIRNWRPVIRLAVVLDTQANGSAPTGGDIYLTPTSSTDTSGSLTLRNLDHVARFKILAVKTLNWTPSETAGSATTLSLSSHSRLVSFTIPLTLLTHYDGTGLNYADMTTNAISLMAQVNSENVATKLPVRFDYNVRTRFIG